jgi:CheY-like chemotaxis protein
MRLAGEHATQLHILLAEDSPANRFIAALNLRKAGHAVTVAHDGLEAVRAFEEMGRRGTRSFFDLVLLDVAMPEMDGLEAARAIREKEKTWGGHVPILAMTAFTTQERLAECLAAGMDACITKPVRIDELGKMMERLLSRDPAPLVAQEAPVAEPLQGKPVALAQALDVMGGDVDIMRSAVAMSLEQIPAELGALKEALVCQDAKGVEARAHRLKSVLGSLGGLTAREAAQQLETIGERGDLVGGPELVKALEREAGRVTAFYSDPQWERLARREARQEDCDG